MKKLLKPVVALSMTLTLSLQLAACGSTGNSTVPSSETIVTESTIESSAETTAETVTESVADTTGTAADAQVSYPVTITDHLDRTVTIEKQPETLVSGYYITSSLLIALGLEDKLVGIEAKAADRNIYSLSAPEIIDLPNVGSAKEFNLEGCAALNPDLVILPAKLKDLIPALEDLGITVIAVNPEDQDLLFEAIDMIDTATNTVAEGTSLKDMITTSLSDLETKLADVQTPNVYFAGNSSILNTAGASMYQNTLLENAAAVNVAASLSDTYWAEVSYEQILEWNPEYIFIASDADYTVDSVLSDAALADCTAIKENHVYQLPADIESLDSPVPGSFLGSFYIASVLHSDLISQEYYSSKVTEFYNTYYGFTPENG